MIKNPVLDALRNVVRHEGTMFENWCAVKHMRAMPAAPSLVAAFIADCAALGPDKVWEAVSLESAFIADAAGPGFVLSAAHYLFALRLTRYNILLQAR